MQRHTTTLDEVRATLEDARIVVCSSVGLNGYSKHLYYQPSANTYIVEHNDKPIFAAGEVYQTMWIDWAIEEYNKY